MNSSFRYLGYVETNNLLKITVSILCILPLYKDAVSSFFNNSSCEEGFGAVFQEESEPEDKKAVI